MKNHLVQKSYDFKKDVLNMACVDEFRNFQRQLYLFSFGPYILIERMLNSKEKSIELFYDNLSVENENIFEDILEENIAEKKCACTRSLS